MSALSAERLLEVWEGGFAQTLTERALALIALALPETPFEALADLTIGARDARLLTLRQQLWGPRMEAVVPCPRCGERLELALDTREMLLCARAEPAGEIRADVDGNTVSLRLPTSRDFLEIAGEQEAASFLERCVVVGNGSEGSLDLSKLSSEALAAISQALVDADPLAEIQLALACPACEHRWTAVFDIVSFLWTEIEAWAWRILGDVHTLARAYGWSEREILALSPTRRQFYLDMVGA